MKKKGGDTRAKAAANGTRVGRPPKAKIIATADKSVASAVLATLDEVAVWRFLLHAEKLEDPKKRDLLTSKERDQIGDHMEYLTNRRDGKPAESIIAEGKLEIVVREISAGNHSATETGDAEKVM
jgi:hypothetical protein